MELNQIPQNPNNWGNVADILNENSGKIEAETAKLNNATTKFKGYFTTSTALSAKWPSPLVGDTAWVGATYPGVVYRCDVAGTWLATTDVPPSNTVNLSEYATQDAVSNEFASVRSDLSEKVSLLSAKIRTYDAGVIPTIENGTDNDYKQAAINLVPESLHVGGMTVLYSKQGDPTKQAIFLPLSSFSTTPEDWFIFPLTEENNPEFIDAKIDVKRNLLESTDYKGNKKFYADVDVYGELKIKNKTFDSKVDKEEGKSLIDDEVKECFRLIEDEEGRTEITIDSDNKLMSYRDAEGKKYEHDMKVANLDVLNLNLQGNSVNNIQDALKANGFGVKTPIDWSESSFIQIPEPRFAIINVSNIDSMPTSKTEDKKAFLEFWDMQGNYFKKHAILNAQGNSSLGFVKKNVAIDFCDDEWIGDDTPKIRIGNWVSQDSFHMKAYYTDFFRGAGAVSYKLYNQIVRTRGNMYDRPWKKALLDMSKIGITTKSIGNPYVDDYSLLTDTGARCFPDGFPVAVYLNGEFYGIFSFQLKKNRDNYHMNKSTAEHVHLDGTINYNNLWNGNVVWGIGNKGFEVRNPKNLYAIGGNKYDADIKLEEIAGEDQVNTWIAAGQLPDGTAISSKIEKNLQMTAKVKKYIQDFANTINTIKAAASTYEASSKTEDDLKTFKEVFEKYYDVENLIDYIIVSDLIKNEDGFNKNWQWFTYDGVKWWVGLYDCDMSFGVHFQGNQITNVLSAHLSTSTSMPNGHIVKYYATELNNRYKQLADLGIASADNIFGLLQDWCIRIGTDFFKEEYNKWADSPCIADSIIRSEYWEAVLDESGSPQTDTSETFNATQAYNVGDVVSFGLNAQMGYFKYKCIKATTALSTNIPHTISDYSPISTFKHCDNIYRAQKWIEQNTANMDIVYNYTRNN